LCFPLDSLLNAWALVFYALRGGGAGSWGVIVSVTIKSFPTFNATQITTSLLAANESVANELYILHAKHIFDWDSVHASQYVSLVRTSTAAGSPVFFGITTYMPNRTTSQSEALMAPFLNASFMLDQQSRFAGINNILFITDDSVGSNAVLGSRLIPAATYHDSPEKVGEVYTKLLSSGTT
jgi:hypothetical protein